MSCIEFHYSSFVVLLHLSDPEIARVKERIYLVSVIVSYACPRICVIVNECELLSPICISSELCVNYAVNRKGRPQYPPDFYQFCQHYALT